MKIPMSDMVLMYLSTKINWVLAVFVAAVLLSSGCSWDAATYVEAGAGTNHALFSDVEWRDRGGVGASIEAGREWTAPLNAYKTKCRWLHLSQWDVGPPFDDRTESSVDHIGCAVRFELLTWWVQLVNGRGTMRFSSQAAEALADRMMAERTAVSACGNVRTKAPEYPQHVRDYDGDEGL